MNLNITLGDKEKTDLIIQRSWLTGSLYYFENGTRKPLKKSSNFSTHLSLKLNNSFEFVVGTEEKHSIRLEHSRPLIFGGIRKHTYDLFVDGELRKSYKGF